MPAESTTPSSRRIRRALLIILLIPVMLWCVVWLLVGRRLDAVINLVEPVPLPIVSERAQALHAGAFVADLHADSLMFGRDLLARSEVAHVDLPRLREGGVALQVFTAVTRAPIGMNIDRTDASDLDAIQLTGLLEPSRYLWSSPWERAQIQAERLRSFAGASDGALVVVESRGDLGALRERRARGELVVGGVLGIEGAHALEARPELLDRAFELGFRMIGLTHFFDNAYAGSAHGVAKSGLTPLGIATLQRMEELGILLDLAHLSPTAVDQVLDLATKPTVFSHGGVKGTCDNLRNLSDAQIRRVAQGGGVIGIGYWETAICGLELRHVVAAMHHVIELVGDDHVALGSDYDGATTVGFDTTKLPALTQALLDSGLGEASIRKILGGNVLRVLARVLPAG